MTKISSKIIKETLGHLGLTYQWLDYTEDEYHVASLFSAIDKGFYFLTESNSFDLEIKNSLIIIHDKLLTGLETHNNQIINLHESDPQQVYYLILNILYGRKSSGVIAKTSVISPRAKLGENVEIDHFCVIEDNVIIEDGVKIGSHTRIQENSIIKKDTTIESGCIIGTQGVAWIWDTYQEQKIVQPQLGGVYIAENCFIGAGTIIVRGSLNENTRIGRNSLLAPGGRIGHGTQIGNSVHFANNVITGGNTIIGDYSFIGSGAVFRPRVVLHPKTIIGAGSVVVKNTSMEGLTLMGVPAKESKTKVSPSGMPRPKL